MKKNYKAYIASNSESQSFDSVFGKTVKSATTAVKRLNSPGWKDCFIWVVFVHPDGQEEKVYENT